LDSKRLGGPNSLRQVCKFRQCLVFMKEGRTIKKNVKQLKPKSKLKKISRRDSGIESVKNIENSDSDCLSESEELNIMEAVEGTGRDSGVGSHDGEIRDWGRKALKRSDKRLVDRLSNFVEDLAHSTSGEISIVFKSCDHPNLPGHNTEPKILCFQGDKKLTSDTFGDWQVEGDHLVNLGIKEEDVLAGRMPEVTTSSQIVVSVGLGIDLVRIGLKKKRNKHCVVAWLTSLLEMSFPDKLKSIATESIWKMLQENYEYVAECTSEEAFHFCRDPLEIPEDVIEMGSIVEEELSEIPNSPNSASQVDLTGLTVNSTALDQALDSVLLGKPVHGEDDNYCYTATVLDMDNLDLSRLANLMSPNRFGASKDQLSLSFLNNATEEKEDKDTNEFSEYPPLPLLSHSLDISQGSFKVTAVEKSPNPKRLSDEGTNEEVPCDTANMVTIKGCSPYGYSSGTGIRLIRTPPKSSPLLSEEDKTAVDSVDIKGAKRVRREPSKFKDYTSPVIK